MWSLVGQSSFLSKRRKGKVVAGLEVVENVVKQGNEQGVLKNECVVSNCGELRH